jgi:hypothetical protein
MSEGTDTPEGKVLSFEEGAKRQRDRRGKSEGLSMFVDPAGKLQIELHDANGRLVRDWYLERADAKEWAHRVIHQIHAIEYHERRLLTIQQPKSMTRSWDKCSVRRDGMVGRNGCRRKEGHAGQCRDKGGDFTPPPCAHKQTSGKPVDGGMYETKCMRCKVRLALEPNPFIKKEEGT